MKIVVGDRNLLPHRGLFESLVPEDATVSWHRRFDEDAIAADLVDADVYVGGRVTPAMAEAGRGLALVHVAGAGTDKIAFDALGSDTSVLTTSHHEDSIAEYVVSVAVLLRRGLIQQDRSLRSGVWATSVYDDLIPQPRTLRGARIGFVGFGNIGRRTWELLRPFGCDGAAVTGRGTVDAEVDGLRWASDTSGLICLMTESDVVVVSTPLNSMTRGMIGTSELHALGPDGILINVARGPVVDEDALFDALSTETIAGAAVDVWYSYPDPHGRGEPSRLRFADLTNVIMTPHSSGVTRDTFVGRVREIATNVCRFAARV
ncbi:2-hydroxyacid dehydrogenase [Rhodococcoides trifolii]|uniref:2-hydroxyacid dehydrogenase n=1 Tax=Rhodococcoides trifolii TaxID=908250 RepID=A0A917CT52_9NOCA|nr:2-hydroxyacid dehydrogenase [Rhodococcus trifolii]GGF98006.1 2-hydroxyacid dehydrogenase [Rhodococcus trifolii]